MVIIDTSLLMERVGDGKIINEAVTFITVIEYPMILEYGKFHGKIFYPDMQDFILALKIQGKLRKVGRMKGASDLVIAAICINNNERLSTIDDDFNDIADVSNLGLV